MPELPGAPTPSGGLGLLESTLEATNLDVPWNTLLWNDPVNLAPVVSGVLVKVLKVSPQKAQSLMLTAHVEGKAAVYSGSQEACQQIADALASFALWATIEKAGA